MIYAALVSWNSRMRMGHNLDLAPDLMPVFSLTTIARALLGETKINILNLDK